VLAHLYSTLVDTEKLWFASCPLHAVVPSVVDVTVVTPYESQVTLKVCVVLCAITISSAAFLAS
jgi:hypothetical protein